MIDFFKRFRTKSVANHGATLHAYACSHGLHGTLNSAPGFIAQDSWSDHIARHLNLQLRNRSKVGASNFKIFSQVLEDMQAGEIRSNDTVIIQWSHINRAYVTDEMCTVMPIMRNDQEQQLADVYYRNFHSDLQNFANLVGYTSYLKTKLNCEIYWAVTDSVKVLTTINGTLVHDMLADSQFIQCSGKSCLEYILSLQKNKQMFFECGHMSATAHRLVADKYTAAITAIRKKHSAHLPK